MKTESFEPSPHVIIGCHVELEPHPPTNNLNLREEFRHLSSKSIEKLKRARCCHFWCVHEQ